MNILVAITFGVFGIGIGLILPDITNQIIRYKNKKRTIEIINRSFNKKFWAFIIVLNGLLWTYSGMRIENSYIAVLISFIFTVAILIAVIDMQIRLIPNELVLLLFCLSIPFQLLFFGWKALFYAFICMVLLGFAFVFIGRILGLEQVGAGDVKLAAVMGLLLGYPNITVALIGMSIGILFFCGIGLITKKLTLSSFFPFAPFLMFGTISTFIYLIEQI
ncbi:MAG: A24 family peptidase [Anaerovorax sp.]|nr:A24 family peptidase [Anaerovorax sp.]